MLAFIVLIPRYYVANGGETAYNTHSESLLTQPYSVVKRAIMNTQIRTARTILKSGLRRATPDSLNDQDHRYFISSTWGREVRAATGGGSGVKDCLHQVQHYMHIVHVIT